MSSFLLKSNFHESHRVSHRTSLNDGDYLGMLMYFDSTPLYTSVLNTNYRGNIPTHFSV